MAKYFRFEDLDIWKEAIQISIILLDIADGLEEKKLWRFTDQLRGVSLSIPNNISESTGSNMIGEQRAALRVAKKESFEAANILVILEIRKLISTELKESTYSRLSILCRRIQTYSDSLGR
ncbi:MAG: four helix bundle protein [Saprospiraceae bacterium]